MQFSSGVQNFRETPGITASTVAARPVSALRGTLYFDSLGAVISRYNGTTWVDYGTPGTPILQGGNSFGAAVNIGSNDAQSLLLKTNAVTRLTITSAGAATYQGGFQVNGILGVQFASNLQNVNISGNTTIVAGQFLQWTSGTQQIVGTGGGATLEFRQPTGGYTYNFKFSGTDYFVVRETGIQTIGTGLISAGVWRLGSVVAAPAVLNNLAYVEVVINGTALKLALIV